LNHTSIRTTIPISQFFVRIAHGCPLQVKKVANCWRKFATRTPMKTRETGPGHQATNPAKNPQNGPRTLCVQTYRDPSSGNMRPSCAVTNPPVIRNVANATNQKMNTDGPAACTPAELLMNRTIATKITTRSNGPSVLATSTGATFSEIIACSLVRLAIRHPLPRRRRPSSGRSPPADIANRCTGGRSCLAAWKRNPATCLVRMGKRSRSPVPGRYLREPCVGLPVHLAAGEVLLPGFRHERVVRVADVRDGALRDLGDQLVCVELGHAELLDEPHPQIAV